MGHFYRHNRQEIYFPDEFGEDIGQEGQKPPQEAGQVNVPIRAYCGYLTSDWFGPFLLSGHNRRERGWC
jgi:hypothetical protein